MNMTLDEWDKYRATLEKDKSDTCEQVGACSNCELAMETTEGLVCPFDKILRAM